MSFIITVYTNEGIVMASDSRSTGSSVQRLPDGKTQTLLGTQITDTTYKTFKCNERIGLSTCGDASINQIPIAGYIENFIHKKVTAESTVEHIAADALSYFTALCPTLSTHFIIAGYNPGSSFPTVHHVRTECKTIINVPTTPPHYIWDGEILTVVKLFQPVYMQNQDGSFYPLQNYGVNFNFFNLQDAINFAQYAVDVTIKTMAFENCVKTVGGPVDILVIKPTESFWVARKELHA